MDLQAFINKEYMPSSSLPGDWEAYLEDFLTSFEIWFHEEAKHSKQMRQNVSKFLGMVKGGNKMKTRFRNVRQEQTEDGAIGSFSADGKVFCWLLEPDDKDPQRFQIPPGVYPVRYFPGNEDTKWHNTMEIIVPGHTALLFHSGNWERQSLGCNLMGSELGKLTGNRAVLNSGNTFRKFQEEIVPTLKEGDQIEIINLF